MKAKVLLQILLFSTLILTAPRAQENNRKLTGYELSELVNEMKYSSNKRVLLEIAFIRLCRPQMENDYDSLINRLHNLEQLNENLQDALENGQFSVAAQSSDSPAAVPVKKKEIRPEAVPEDVRAVVGNWKQILRQLNPVTRNMLVDVVLSVSDAGAPGSERSSVRTH